ncbi:MAG: hypothetical protein PHI87_06200 [Candidatus Methanomethylophilus sp.]|jgi:hypothetical protein|nr:hypothetical protein [Methanomethylophilus sp.]MDD4222502.1 hypothetical protein [Methanomethylophilus sp.]MDY0247909.1 hypothetical protein [Methanosarcina mazei]
MSIFRTQKNTAGDDYRTRKKELQLEKQRIANAEANAKVEERRAKTRIREQNGGASIQVKLAKTTGNKISKKGKR